MLPIVGITSSPARHRSPVLGVDRSLTTLDRAYVDAVARAGGVPLVLPVQAPATADRVVEVLDAVVLSGGGDVAPERYGAVRHPAVAGVDAERDEWELAVIEQARRRGTPILAICRGVQILNVSMGGTLIQHLSEPDGGHGDPHLVPDRFDAGAHHVEIVSGSGVAKVLDTDRVEVNTLHHQAIDRLASPLVAVGRDQHGVIEAIEHPDEPIIGVQWHPELICRRPPHERLFQWLVDAAGGQHPPTAG